MKQVKFVKAMVFIKEKGYRKGRPVHIRIEINESFSQYPEEVQESIVYKKASENYGKMFLSLSYFDIRDGLLIDGNIYTPETGFIS